MSMLPWDGNSLGTKRRLACEEEPEDQRARKLRNNTRPPVEIASLFHGDDSDDGRRDEMPVDTEAGRRKQDSVERAHDFHGTVVGASESPSHLLSGSVLSHGSFAFAQWLVQNRSILDGRRVLELKSGMGVLAIFLRKAIGVDITTSDFDDKEVEYTIDHNCRINNLAALPHIRHTWGDPFPVSRPDWDIVIASDIEPYVEQATNLIKTLSFLLREYKQKCQRAAFTAIINKSGTQVPVRFPISLISWRQRIDPSILFLGCEKEGLEVQHLGYLVYLIKNKN